MKKKEKDKMGQTEKLHHCDGNFTRNQLALRCLFVCFFHFALLLISVAKIVDATQLLDGCRGEKETLSKLSSKIIHC